MIRVYHAQRARSARVIWLLEELGLPYEVGSLELTPASLKSAEHLQRHPLGLVPLLEDGSLSIFESGAILQYLLETYGQGRLEPAKGSPQRAPFLQWFHYGEATLTRYVSDIVRQRFREADTPEITLSRSRARFTETVGVVERVLARQAYLCGADFSAADIMVSYGLSIARIIRELPPEFSACTAYLERLRQRPAYVKAWS